MARGVELDTFYVLDFDRTLFDTEKAFGVLEAVIERHDLGLATLLQQKYDESKRSRTSFSVHDFILEFAGEKETSEIQAAYTDAALKEELLLPGAKELLSFIHTTQATGAGILTYGSPEGQTMKINATAGLQIPYLVTTEVHKGEQIAAWRQKDGTYRIPEALGRGAARSIVLVDDKPVSFESLPSDVVGYIVPSIFDAGVDELPSRVVKAKDLFDVVAHEASRTS